MTERFVKTDPLAERDERKLVRFLQSEISSFAKQVVQAGFERVIGTSGTILSLGTMAAYEMDGAEPDELRNRRIPSKQIRKLREKLTSLSLAERLRIPGMEPRRGDLAVAGSVILDTILRELDAEDITLCDLALREGLVLDYIHQHRTEIARADRYPDVRRRSVVELGERCNYFAQHAAQVSRLAVSMFDQTRGVHGLKDREREWLEYAALLHDVGVHISYDKHHRHSYYLIKHGDLRGFDPQEIEVIGLIARYHRRASPKKGHPGYGELPSDLRKAVKVLSSIVRLAEGLDRSHVQVLDSITLANRGDDYLMQLRTNGDAELELWAAGRHVEPLEDTLGKPVRFEVAPAPARAKRTPVRASAPAKTASAG